jgi:CRISPR-associated protein Csd2
MSNDGAKTPIANRYDFVFLFDVKNGNPNGDPDAGNAPRIDDEGYGLVTDVCLKRRVRNYVQVKFDDKSPNAIFVKHGTNLNTLIARAHEETGGMPPFKNGGWEAVAKKVGKAGAWLCQNYCDIRTFGGVLSTGPKAGQIRGPVQFAFARSVERIPWREVGITRGAVADNTIKGENVGSIDFKKWEEEQPEDKLRTMGRKSIVFYGLYRMHGFVSAALAKTTGFSDDDLNALWDALCGRHDQESPIGPSMFDFDRSTSKGEMAARKLIVFKHVGTNTNSEQKAREAALGCAPSHRLFESVKVERTEKAKKDPEKATKAFSDYVVTVDRTGVPAGVEVMDLI